MPVRGYYGSKLQRRYTSEFVTTRYDSRLKRLSGLDYRAEVIADTPSAYYRLGDASTPAIPDSFTPTAPNLVATGAVVFGTPGVDNSAVAFSGNTGGVYLQAPTGANGQVDLGNGPFSFEFAYRLTASGVAQTFLSKGTGAYLVRMTAGNQFALDLDGGANCFITTAGFPDTTAWHHFLISVGGGVFAYVDGVNVAGTFTNQTFADSTTGLGLGVDVANKTSGYFSGCLDEVALYPHAVAAARVLMHFQAAVFPVIDPGYVPQAVARRLRAVPVRHARAGMVVPADQPAQLNGQPRRLRGALVRRGRQPGYVPDQVFPPATAVFVPQALQPRRVRGWPVRHRVVQAPADQQGVFGGPAKRARWWSRRRPQQQLVSGYVGTPAVPHPRRATPSRRGRAVPMPVPAQALPSNPVFVPQPPARRVRGWWSRRRTGQIPPDPQIPSVPTFVPQPATHRLRWAPSRPRRAAVAAEQPTVTSNDQPRRSRGWTVRRTRPSGPLPAQAAPVAPVYPGQPTAQPRRLRGLGRRGRPLNVVQTQLPPPAYPGAPTAQPRRLRGALARRGKLLLPPPAPTTPPAFVPQASTVRRIRGMWPRPRRTTVPSDTYRPSTVPARRTRLSLRRSRPVLVVPTQATPMAPVLPLQRPPARVRGYAPRRHATTVPTGHGHPIPFTRGRIRVVIRRRKVWRVFIPSVAITQPGFGAVTSATTGAALSATSTTGRPTDTGTHGTATAGGTTGQVGDTPTGKGSL